jgi:TPR repeat protein
MRKIFCIVIAMLYSAVLFENDNSLKELKKKAGEGDSSYQYELGMEYLEGSNIKQDNAEAVMWLKRAA